MISVPGRYCRQANDEAPDERPGLVRWMDHWTLGPRRGNPLVQLRCRTVVAPMGDLEVGDPAIVLRRVMVHGYDQGHRKQDAENACQESAGKVRRIHDPRVSGADNGVNRDGTGTERPPGPTADPPLAVDACGFPVPPARQSVGCAFLAGGGALR